MQKMPSIIFGLLLLSACQQSPKSNNRNDKITFKVSLNPSFDERADITLLKTGNEQNLSCLISSRVVRRDIKVGEKTLDTFYNKAILLSNNQYTIFDSLVIQKTKIKQPHQWTGCCDGMPVTFMLIKNTDTSFLYFRSPSVNEPDSSGYRITKSAIDQFKMLFNDSMITDYLYDVEGYMDDSKFHRADPKRKIDQLRMKKYNLRISEK